MSSIQVVPETPRVSGQPEWIERSLNVKAGRDPLGLQTITLDRIMPILLPGILVLSQRARYFSLFPFLLRLYEEVRLPPTNEALSENCCVLGVSVIAVCRNQEGARFPPTLLVFVRSSHAAARLQRNCFAPVAFTRRLSNEMTAFAQD